MPRVVINIRVGVCHHQECAMHDKMFEKEEKMYGMLSGKALSNQKLPNHERF